jgi:hypothetical protein
MLERRYCAHNEVCCRQSESYWTLSACYIHFLTSTYVVKLYDIKLPIRDLLPQQKKQKAIWLM